MATRYWVGGGSSTNWDATSNTNWSATDGGSNNASVPTVGDDVFMKSAADCVVNVSVDKLNSFNMTGYSGTMSGTSRITVQPADTTTVSVVIAGTITWSATLALDAPGTSVINLTTNGKTLKILYANGFFAYGTGTINLQDAVTLNGSGNSFFPLSGTFNTNGFSMNLGTSTFCANETHTATCNLSTSTITGSFLFSNTLMTLNASSSTLASSSSFAGGGFTFGTVNFATDNTVITGSNTFGTLNVNQAGNATGLKFTVSTTQTILNTFATNGSSGNLAKILSTSAGTAFTMTKGGGNGWFAGTHSTDVSGNTGWTFTDPGASPTVSVDYMSIKDSTVLNPSTGSFLPRGMLLGAG